MITVSCWGWEAKGVSVAPTAGPIVRAVFFLLGGINTSA